MRDGSLRHVDREIDWRKRVCGTVREKKKKRTKRKSTTGTRVFFYTTRLVGRISFVSRFVLFYFILLLFFFRFLPNIHGRQGYLYPCINVFYLFVERQRKDLYMYNELLYFFLFFIIYYYHFGFSLFFFLISHTHYALLYILYIQYFLRQTRQRFSVMQTVPKTDRETLNNV